MRSSIEACGRHPACASESTRCSGPSISTPAAFWNAAAPVCTVTAHTSTSRSERPGTQIGPYKLLEQIGEGGMGTVYVAQQSEPVKRLVALKIIKAGMDSRQVIARFEAERQALALMDHPNIAKVLDAGTDRAGPALLRDGAGQGRADHAVLRRAPSDPASSGWSCSCRSARRSSTRIRRGSSTGT